jgi:hypothetical protein
MDDRAFCAEGFRGDERLFLLTVRYGIGHADPIQQRQGDERRIKQLLGEVDYARVIKIEISVQS